MPFNTGDTLFSSVAELRGEVLEAFGRADQFFRDRALQLTSMFDRRGSGVFQTFYFAFKRFDSLQRLVKLVGDDEPAH